MRAKLFCRPAALKFEGVTCKSARRLRKYHRSARRFGYRDAGSATRLLVRPSAATRAASAASGSGRAAPASSGTAACACASCRPDALGIAAFFFWQRLLTVCLHSANATAVVRLAADPSSSADASVDAAISEATANASGSLPGATATVEFVVPMSVNSSNLWGFRVESMSVDAYYAGDRDVAIARGSVDDFSLVAQGTSYNDLVLPPNPAGFDVYRYLAEDCGPLIPDEASWPLDLRVELSFLFVENYTYWIEDLQMPCATLEPVTPVGPWFMDDGCGWADGRMGGVDGAWANGAWGKGQYCKSILRPRRPLVRVRTSWRTTAPPPTLPLLPAPSASRLPAAPTPPGRPSAG